MRRPSELIAVVLLLQQGVLEVRPQEASHSRIVGGIDTLMGDWPWQVSVTYNAHHVCGGSLIDTNTVLTAAHCFPSDHSLKDYIIKLGVHTLNVYEENAVTASVARVIINPSYVEGSSGDIALVKLSNPVVFNERIKPIPLPSSMTQFPVGMKCMVTGWGNIRSSVTLPSPGILQAAEVPIIGRDRCNCLYKINPSSSEHQQEIMSDMICAGLVGGGKDACQGDSGGPLSCKVNGVYYQAAVVSWGDECGAPNRPGVYILVSINVNWILANAPGAQVMSLHIDATPSTEQDGGCVDASGVFHPSGASALMLVAASLPFYLLTVHLLSAF